MRCLRKLGIKRFQSRSVFARYMLLNMQWPTHPCPKHSPVCVPRGYGDCGPDCSCPKHNPVRVSRAYGDQSIQAQHIIQFVFQVFSRCWKSCAVESEYRTGRNFSTAFELVAEQPTACSFSKFTTFCGGVAAFRAKERVFTLNSGRTAVLCAKC